MIINVNLLFSTLILNTFSVRPLPSRSVIAAFIDSECGALMRETLVLYTQSALSVTGIQTPVLFLAERAFASSSISLVLYCTVFTPLSVSLSGAC